MTRTLPTPRHTLTTLLPAAASAATFTILAGHQNAPTLLAALLTASSFAALITTQTRRHAALLGLSLTSLSLLTSLNLLRDPLSGTLTALIILAAAMTLRAHPARELTPLLLITGGLLISATSPDYLPTGVGAAVTFTGALLTRHWPNPGGLLRAAPAVGAALGLISGTLLLALIWDASGPFVWITAALLAGLFTWNREPHATH